jgi:hypothetical protein
MGVQLFCLQNSCQELGSPFLGKAAFLYLRPWGDFVKGQEQHGMFELWENDLYIFYT